MTIPAKTVIKFKAGKALGDEVNGWLTLNLAVMIFKETVIRITHDHGFLFPS